MENETGVYTTWRDAKGRLWVIVKLYYPELDAAEPSGITLYRVGSKDERQHVDIKEWLKWVQAGLFKLTIN